MNQKLSVKICVSLNIAFIAGWYVSSQGMYLWACLMAFTLGWFIGDIFRFIINRLKKFRNP